MNRSKILTLLAAAALAAAGTSCRDAEPAPEPAPREVEVRIGLPETRTALGDDGLSTRWEKGDRMALWAYAGGTAAFANAPFVYYGGKPGSGSRALFSGTVAAMGAGTYTYYAASPVPAAVSGTRVTYDLPAVQDGAWHGEWDVLLARASAPALKEHKGGADDVNALDLHFRHKVHAVKVTVPTGRNRFERPVRRMRVEFPRPVAGRLTWDMAAPDAAPSIEPVSNAVTLEFARPVGEGDSFWIFIAPGDMAGGAVRFTATDGEEFSWPIETGAFRNCAAGEITSVTLTVPTVRPSHDFRVTMDSSHLGETVTEAEFIGPEGYVFATLQASNTSGKLTPASDGRTFMLRLFDDQGDFPTSSELVVGSRSAENVRGRLGSAQCRVTGLTAAGCAVEAPYLFYEDFSGISDFSNFGNYDRGIIVGDKSAISFLSGWTGARIAGQTATSIRLACRRETATTNEQARVDSAPIAKLKSGVSAKVSVVFDYGMGRWGGTIFSDGANLGGNVGQTVYCGYVKNANAFSSRATDGSTIQDFYIKENDANYTTLPHKNKSYQIPDCDNQTRLTWRTKPESNSGANNNTCWLYLDNICVTIVQ